MAHKPVAFMNLKNEQAQNNMAQADDDRLVSEVIAGKNEAEINQWLEVQKQLAIKEMRSKKVRVNESKIGRAYVGRETIVHPKDHNSMEIAEGGNLTVKEFRGDLLVHEIEHTQRKHKKMKNPDGETIETPQELKWSQKEEDHADRTVGKVAGPVIGIYATEKLSTIERMVPDPKDPHRTTRQREMIIREGSPKNERHDYVEVIHPESTPVGEKGPLTLNPEGSVKLDNGKKKPGHKRLGFTNTH